MIDRNKRNYIVYTKYFSLFKEMKDSTPYEMYSKNSTS